MNSLKKMAEVAGKFERKLAQQMQRPDEGGNPQVIRDAFFGSSTGSGGKSQEGFAGQNPPGYIWGESSNFQKALASLPATAHFNIGVMVNVPKNVADFTGAPPALKAALLRDYATYFGKAPIDNVKEKVAAGAVASTVAGSAPSVVTV